MAPVEASRDRPAGSDGETDHEVTVPPLEVGVVVVMVVPLVNVKEFCEYATDEGATSLTTMVTEAVVLPPVFVAVTV